MTSIKDELTKRIGQKSPRSCQDCGATLRYRQNRENLTFFLGCGRWPECHYTEEIPESLKMSLMGQKGLFMEDQE